MFRFTIRDLFWLVLLVGVSCAWWLDRRSNDGVIHAPTNDEVIAEWERSSSTAPVLAERRAKTLRITKHLIAEYCDPPINGMATWHNHYKCAIHCEQAGVEEVVYLDKVASRPVSSP